MNYQNLIEEVYNEVMSANPRGKVADYIPELARVDGDKFGIALVDLEGNTFGAGDFEEPFSIQSISKVYTLTMVASIFKNKLWSRVNVEPSGDPFNSIAQLEFEKGIPRNPFINAGALVITDALTSKFENPIAEISKFIDELNGETCININQEVMDSELNHSERNTALGYFLKAYDNFEICVSSCLHVWVNCRNNQSIKRSIPKISPIELVNKFIEVVLEVFVGDHVVYSQEFPLQIADCFMYPSERVVGGIFSGDNREVCFYDMLKL